jgi:hypothetical protein
MNSSRSEWYFPADQLAVLFLQFGVPLIGITAGCFLPAVSAARHGNPFLFWVALLLAVVGIMLLFVARLPLYRQGKFRTFGSAGLPEKSRKVYRVAYGFIGISVVIMVFLLAVLKRGGTA